MDSQTDTGKVRVIKEIKERLLLLEKDKNVVVPDETKYTPSYILLIGFIVLIGFGAVTLLTWMRPDFDFVVVSISVFAVVTMVATNIFTIMRQNQTLKETHEANVKAQLVLEQSRRTHDIANHLVDEYKEAYKLLEFMKGKEAERSEEADRKVVSQDKQDARTDSLIEKI